MPAYDYVCDKCGHTHEVTIKAEWRDELNLACPNDGTRLRRKIAAPLATLWAGKFHDRWYQKEDRDGLGPTW